MSNAWAEAHVSWRGAADDGDRPGVCGACPAAVRCGGALLDVLVSHRASLIQFARSFVGCISRAEDVVHDVFIKLTGFRNQEDIRQPLAYVMRMVRNASIDACRRQSLENVWYAGEEEGLDVASPEPSPEAALLTRDALRSAFDALAELPERTRCAFERVRLREETLQETARALGVSQTLVHFMVRDAARHCADCVEGNGDRSMPTKKRRASNVNHLGTPAS
ncbi:RNA polymerase factor sigma-70 [Trinickia sp. NRRL B-1857]|uniref:RNA polymerase factor sigma-70 n=1 Tax=Trinickia sp. NRRL B-1857 TaxID=3162879 RepID=UPI003D2B515D